MLADIMKILFNSRWLHNAIQIKFATAKSSRPKVFCKKVILKTFAKFTVKYLCQSFF